MRIGVRTGRKFKILTVAVNHFWMRTRESIDKNSHQIDVLSENKKA